MKSLKLAWLENKRIFDERERNSSKGISTLCPILKVRNTSYVILQYFITPGRKHIYS
jgi:hypothetical protein